MILSKNAVGNLINRYKAVLGKCRLLNAFGSLALAAALTLGSAGLAVAADTEWGPGKDVVIDSVESTAGMQQAKTLTVNASGELSNGGSTGHIYVSDAIELHTDGDITLKGPYGIMGAADNAAETVGNFTGSFNMTGGNLDIDGSQLQMNAVTLSGGTVSIADKIDPGVNWDDGAMLVGGLGGSAFNMTGGTVTIGDSGQMVGGNVNISNGLVSLGGATAADAAILRSYGSANALTISGGAINVAEDKYGVITANKVNITGGTVDVNGNLTLAAALTKGQSLSDALVDSANAATATVNQTGGTVTIADTGTMTLNKGMTYTLSGSGQLSSSGTIELNYGTHMNLKKGHLDVNGGKFVVNGSASEGYSHLKFSSESFATAMSGGSLSINGGFVSAGDSATLNAAQFVGSNPDAGEISLNGGNLYAEDMTINTADGTIDTVNSGVLTSDTLNIQSGGNSGSVDVENTTLNLTGKNSTLTVMQGDDAATLNLDDTSSLLIGADPNLYSGPKTAIINAVVNVNGGSLMVGYDNGSGRTDAATATFTKNVTVGDDGDQGILLVTEGSIMSMGAGTTLNIHNAGATVNGTLDVTAEGSALQTTASDGKLTVEQGGRLNATSDSLGITGTASDNIKEKLTVEGGGTLKVDGLGELSSTNIGSLKGNLMTGSGLFDVGNATITGITPTGGTVAYDNVSALGNITSDSLRTATVTDVNGALSGAYAGVELGGSTTELEIADGATLQLTGAKGGNIVEGGSGEAGVSVAGTGTLVLGDAASGNSGTVGNVNLGTGGGSLLAVGNGSGAFTVGDITGTGSTITASGTTLNAEAIGTSGAAVNSVSTTNGRLTATSINAGTVNANNGGSIMSQGNISATDMTADNGGIVAGGDITVTSDLNANNGDIYATGDIAVTGAANVTGGSLAAQSLAVGADSSFTDGAQVNVGTLDAGGKTITVGNSTDTKSTSLVAGNLTLGGGSLLIDPDWAADGPSYVVVGGIPGNEIDGNVGVGQNSLLTIGTLDKGWLAGQVNAVTNGAGLAPGGVTAALGLKEA